MENIENNKKKKKKFSIKKWFKNINWTRLLALLLVIVMLASFVSTLVYYMSAAK